ncbi:hypothetical protein CHS0354_007652 [Potamilus streckersoni]|uniref:protein-tyrosine-phosphatase n=1 Tax=Potamilus streckersoni TaxID=2493646 RepID=A0AAE0SHI4_9BIVA|nr:hypothetical protein CHS0354_007652 [Potamilus streckersoni]
MSEFDSSDDESSGVVDLSPFKISWLDLNFLEFNENLGICGLPGCRFKDTWRSLEHDINYLVNEEVQEVFSLCTKGELKKYRVPLLLQEITSVNIAVHHYPFSDGHVPGMQNLMKMIDEIYAGLVNGKKTVIHCYGGLGRSCLVAVCLLMVIDEGLSAEAAITKVRDLRGPRAIHSVKQYNFVYEFREHLTEYKKTQADEIQRSVSR